MATVKHQEEHSGYAYFLRWVVFQNKKERHANATILE